MQSIIGLLFCVLLGFMVAEKGWFSLIWMPLGFAIGLFVTAQIALPIVLGLPRAVRLVERFFSNGALSKILWVDAPCLHDV
jgi:hypothetical protein